MSQVFIGHNKEYQTDPNSITIAGSPRHKPRCSVYTVNSYYCIALNYCLELLPGYLLLSSNFSPWSLNEISIISKTHMLMVREALDCAFNVVIVCPISAIKQYQVFIRDMGRLLL